MVVPVSSHPIGRAVRKENAIAWLLSPGPT
jgi:hypothetical protein